MKREIKFRAWDKKRKSMFVPDSFVFDENTGEIMSVWRKGTDGETIGGLDPRKVRLILMQSTGFHDKNGQSIYDGDIVRVQETMDNGRIVCLEAVSTVVWNGQLGCWCCHGEFDGNLADYAAGTMLNAMGNICEVIGNIFEDKQLMEGKYEQK